MVDPETTPVEEEEIEHKIESVDFDSLSDSISPSQTAILFGNKTTAVTKQNISRLPPALDPDGKPLFVVGDKIIIERYATILAGAPYLDTKTYRVLEINHETGDVKLYDDLLRQFAGDNWITGPQNGSIYKFAQGKIINSHKKRGRPRKLAPGEKKPVNLGPDGLPRRRGRPPGAKTKKPGAIVENVVNMPIAV